MIRCSFSTATFGIQNIIVHLNGTITCQYMNGSEAQGSLVVAYQGGNLFYAILHNPKNGSQSRSFALEDFDRVSYEIWGFDLEKKWCIWHKSRSQAKKCYHDGNPNTGIW